MLQDVRNWIEARCRRDGTGAPGFRWVDREDPRRSAPVGQGVLVAEDRELRLLLVLADLPETRDPEAAALRIRTDLAGARELAGQCMPGEGPGLPGGAEAWRVALHWVGSAEQEAVWRASLLAVRQEGPLLEALSVNGTFLEPGEAIGEALDRTGIPVLLLAARAALRRDAGAARAWAGADARVREAVLALEAGLASPRAKAIARELAAVARAHAEAPAPAPAPPRRLGRIRVERVRGIRDLTLEPWPGLRPVQAWVVSGPNGSGKSSLAEAVALRAFGSSPGLVRWLGDPDVTKGRTPVGYVERCLRPLGGGEPRCAFDGDEGRIEPAPDLATALEGLAEMEGTINGQGGPMAFLQAPGDELGARMARSFSALAVRLEARAAEGRAAAGEARAALARRHGISASTKLAASFREKIAAAEAARARPTLPPAARAFLACRAGLPGPEGPRASALLAAWDAAPEPPLAALLRLSPPDLEGALRPWLEGEARRAADTAAFLDAFRETARPLALPPGLDALLPAWAAWLETASAAPPPRSPEVDRLLAERAAVQAEGTRTRPRHDHLEQALAFIRNHWGPDHPRECPTCGSHLDRPAQETVSALLAAAAAQLQAQREAYGALTRRLKELEETPARACPVPAEALRHLEAAAGLLGAGAEALARDPRTREPFAAFLAFAAAPPTMEAPEVVTAACAAAIARDWAEAEEILAEPEAWDQVAKALTERLASVVAAHLPATVEGLWLELAACLSPAPWLLPAQPRFQARTVRGANRVDVVLDAPDGEPRLARHLLNAAQGATLGLAWTFCQHLVASRFRHAWILLDDPDQDMDQPAFRAFCRFLASFMGLCEAAALPFTAVLFLHQEERALEAARETGQGLVVLGWTACQEDATARRVTLFGEGVRSPQPADIWTEAAG